MNNISITGRLVYEPELKNTQSGATFMSNRIAVNRADKNKTTDFFNIQAWNKTAEFIYKYFSKGDPIEISGRLQTENYEKKDGTKVNDVVIVALDVNFTLSKAATAPTPAPAEPQSAPAPDYSGEGLPFEI